MIFSGVGVMGSICKAEVKAQGKGAESARVQIEAVKKLKCYHKVKILG